MLTVGGEALWLTVFMGAVASMVHISFLAKKKGGGSGWNILLMSSALIALLSTMASGATEVVILIAGLISAALYAAIRWTLVQMRRQQP